MPVNAIVAIFNMTPPQVVAATGGSDRTVEEGPIFDPTPTTHSLEIVDSSQLRFSWLHENGLQERHSGR
jgi:hypothetical protein